VIPLYISDVNLHCLNEAAEIFHVPAKLLISILNTEQGKVGITVKNHNGTYDIGPMQINSSWVPTLKKYGISEYQLKYDSCINIKVGAWIAAKAIASENNLLIGIGDYNSHTQRYNQNYSHKVRVNFTKLHLLLD
jgi:hypothetical protein